MAIDASSHRKNMTTGEYLIFLQLQRIEAALLAQATKDGSVPVQHKDLVGKPSTKKAASPRRKKAEGGE